MATTTAVHPADVIAGVPMDALRDLRVLIVNMPLRESAPPNCAPLGPALLAARLEQYGAKVSLADLNAERFYDEAAKNKGLQSSGRHPDFEEACRLLRRYADKLRMDPQLVCFSGKITTLRWQKWVAAYARHEWPDALLVSGGGLATEFKEGLFRWVPQLDAIAHSEGDDIIVKIGLDALAITGKCFDRAFAHGDLAPYTIESSAVYIGPGGENSLLRGIHRMVYGGDRPRDLDALPAPAWHLLPPHVMEAYLTNEIWGLKANNSSATPFKMTRSINTVSSRGCPFACRFCFRGGQGERNYGIRSAQSMAAEFEHLHKAHGVDFVGVLDDNFMVQAGRIAELKDTVGRVCFRTGMRWGTHGRLDEAADLRPGSGSVPWGEGRVERMAYAGCVYIGFGAESASPKVLEAMGKGGFMLANGTRKVNGYDLPVTMLEGYARTIKAGIHGNCTWIMGYPGETLEDIKHTVAFIEWQKTLVDAPAVNQRMFTATAYPGTEMFANATVRQRLSEGFGLDFDRYGQPIVNDALERYVLELDDATKVLTDRHGRPVYYGAMTEDQFLRVRDLVDSGQTSKVMDL